MNELKSKWIYRIVYRSLSRYAFFMEWPPVARRVACLKIMGLSNVQILPFTHYSEGGLRWCVVAGYGIKRTLDVAAMGRHQEHNRISGGWWKLIFDFHAFNKYTKRHGKRASRNRPQQSGRSSFYKDTKGVQP